MKVTMTTKQSGMRCGVRAVQPEAAYPLGFFTAPVRAWKQLQFESGMEVDKWGHMVLLAHAERARQRATGKGWGRGTIALPGTPDFQPQAAGR